MGATRLTQDDNPFLAAMLRFARVYRLERK
jgi:hypothetical protein